MLVGPDALPVGFETRQFPGTRSGGNDDRLGGKHFLSGVRPDHDLALGGHCCLSHDDLDLVPFHEMADAAVKLLCDAARSLYHGIEVILDVLGLQSELFGAVHQVEHL